LVSIDSEFTGRLITKFVWLVATAAVFLSAESKPIDLQQSTITIHVGKAGLLSVAGHEHWVEAPISSGVLDESGPPHVEFTVDAAKLTVKPHPKADAKTQAEIQRDMQEKTLESAKYPEIVFRSTRVQKYADSQWRVEGTLMLHGVTKPMTVTVKSEAAAYVGRARLKQTDFGITPISAAAGTVKVKNELDIDFRIVTGLR
jgi:polyisoprenoid-binding protein YceI